MYYRFRKEENIYMIKKQIAFLFCFIGLLLLSGCKEKNIIEESEGMVIPQEIKMQRKYSDLKTDWINGYIVIMNTVFTKIDNNVGEPVFSLYELENGEPPLMITGYQKEDGSGKYYIYSYEDTTLYDLGELTGNLYINKEEEEIYVETEDGNYLYQLREHRLWMQPKEDSDFSNYLPLDTRSLKDSQVNSDNIVDFIIK